MDGERDRVRAVLNFQGRTHQWLARQTGISFWRLTKLLAGEQSFWDWEAEQVSLALQVPVDLLFPDTSILKKGGRQRGSSRTEPQDAGPEAVAS